jgi:hypothetical protein
MAADYSIRPDGSIRRAADGAVLPADLESADYQAYLRWVEAGNLADVDPTPEFSYCAVATARERLEARGKWGACAALLMQYPDLLLHVLTVRSGIDPQHPQARAMIAALGEDPDVILEPDVA